MEFLKIIFLLFYSFSFGQKGFEISTSKKTVITFKLINNLIFVPLNINGVDLTFLLDSGVNETILFSLEDKEIDFNETEKINFSGLGESKDIEGVKSERNIVTIGKNYKDVEHTVFIILDESINFSSHVGIPVNGIIGYHFFKNHQILINYSSKKITVFDDDKIFNRKKTRYEEFPLTLEGNKPYMLTDVELTDTKVESKMLVDLGNSDAIWLFPKLIENFEYNRPNIDDFLGRGFNGDIFGKRSRIHRLYLGDYVFEKPLTAMPDEYSIQSLKLVPDRKGSIGSEILRRFTVIFDYPNEKLYLKKNTSFNDKFRFSSTGLDIQHDGLDWEKDLVRIETKKSISNQFGNRSVDKEETFYYNFVLKPKFSVAGCRKESPCAEAGIQKNDQLVSINNRRVSGMSLEKINEYFKDQDGTKLRLELIRNDETLNITLILKDPIPYEN